MNPLCMFLSIHNLSRAEGKPLVGDGSHVGSPCRIGNYWLGHVLLETCAASPFIEPGSAFLGFPISEIGYTTGPLPFHMDATYVTSAM